MLALECLALMVDYYLLGPGDAGLLLGVAKGLGICHAGSGARCGDLKGCGGGEMAKLSLWRWRWRERERGVRGY
jgi:hypothetical protein